MIKKHQTRSIYTTYQITSLKQLLNKTFEPTKGNTSIIEENLKKRNKETFVSFLD